MLTLFLAAIHIKLTSGHSDLISSLPSNYQLDSIYINSELPFPELAEFIETSTQRYQLNLVSINDTMKDGFEHYLNNVNTNTKAIVVGIRYADPYGLQLQYEQNTDHHWPAFLRIHPILHWQYTDVWDFLVACNLPYCSLYDKGYTSLGGIDTTLPNKYLQHGDTYLPAYMLQEQADDRERVGRIKSR